MFPVYFSSHYLAIKQEDLKSHWLHEHLTMIVPHSEILMLSENSSASVFLIRVFPQVSAVSSNLRQLRGTRAASEIGRIDWSMAFALVRLSSPTIPPSPSALQMPLHRWTTHRRLGCLLTHTAQAHTHTLTGIVTRSVYNFSLALLPFFTKILWILMNLNLLLLNTHLKSVSNFMATRIHMNGG